MIIKMGFKILSIDIGLLNLAIVGISLCEDYLSRREIIKENEIFMCELVDITELTNECNDQDCILYHDKIICDYISHLFKKFKKEFDDADKILIERQPILSGLVAVQELIMKEYRNKCILISPSAMLSYFGILQCLYSERKNYTEKIACQYLNSFKNFTFNTRRHDMADSLVILYYYLTLERKKYVEKEIKKNYPKEFKDLSMYEYKPQ